MTDENNNGDPSAIVLKPWSSMPFPPPAQLTDLYSLKPSLDPTSSTEEQQAFQDQQYAFDTIVAEYQLSGWWEKECQQEAKKQFKDLRECFPFGGLALYRLPDKIEEAAHELEETGRMDAWVNFTGSRDAILLYQLIDIGTRN
jgi:hypothetical protein